MTKREEIARAMWDAAVRKMKADDTLPDLGQDEWPWESESEAHHDCWLTYADAALSALMTPNEVMITDGKFVILADRMKNTGSVISMPAEAVFTAMIRAAAEGRGL